MDSERSSNKKMCFSSKSQFNKNIKKQLQNLHCIRENNLVLSDTLPDEYLSTNKHDPFHPIEKSGENPNNSFTVIHNVSNPTNVSVQTFTENHTSTCPTFIQLVISLAYWKILVII